MINLEKILYSENNKLHSIKRYDNLPYKNGRNNRICWIDNTEIRYTYDITKEDTLYVLSPFGYYPDSIVKYINNLPKEIKTVVLDLNSKVNETAGLDILFETLRKNKTNRNIIIPVNKYKFSLENGINYYRLPKNIKISNTFNKSRLDEKDYYGENSLDWWSLHLNNDQFEHLTSYMTMESKKRAKSLRTIAEEFGRYIFVNYKNFDKLSDVEKANIAFDWVCRVTRNDNSSIIKNNDGIMIPKPNCEYASDPIETLNRRRGICTGRSRLLKLLLNNRYMKVPCYLVKGKNAAGSDHEWVEVRSNDRIYYYDPSYGIRGEKTITHDNISHEDYEISGDLTKYNKKEIRRTPYPTHRKTI